MKFFIETNPCVDEYTGQAIGIFLPNGFCIFGLLVYAGQIGIIVMNICAGVWTPDD